jgi:hypothetical protein
LVYRVNLSLRWVRRRQRVLTRDVLALFCAAWLQAAIVPCVMAHPADLAPQVRSPAHHQHDAHAGHDHGAMTAPHHDRGAPHPCLYCPPGASGVDSCDGHGGCAYPHEPQVDARGAGAIFTAVPVSFVATPARVQFTADRADATLPDIVPKVSLSVSYCRFIE